MKNNSLIKQKINYQSLFHCIPDLYLLLDPDFNIVEANEAFCKATKTNHDAILNHNVFDVFKDNPYGTGGLALKNFKNSLETVLSTKKPDAMAVQRYDLPNPIKSNEFEKHYWSPINIPILNPNHSMKYILHRVEDVTDFINKKNEEFAKNKANSDAQLEHSKRDITLRAQQIEEKNYELQIAYDKLAKVEYSQARLAAIVEFTDDAIIAKSLDGIIQTWNPGAEKLYGYKPEEVIGKSIQTIFPDNHQQEFIEILQQVKKDVPVHFMETERKHKDGHLIPVSVTISPIKNKDGKIIGACSIARDISEWKKVQEMKDDFISMVSHELRTPLTSIQGSLSLLVQGTVGAIPEKAFKLLEIAEKNSQRLIRLINDILDIAKIESGKINLNLKLTQLTPLIKEAISSNQSYGDKFGIKIKLLNTKDVLINVDKDRFLQVMANLISNAIKFSENSKEIKIKVSQHQNKVRVAITNKGLGISDQFKNKIFKKFVQLKTANTRTIAGTGLGLSISKEIIEKLNGTINFTSEPNKETTFYFDLPIYSQAEFTEKTFEKIPKILICENDENIRELLKKQLADYHCKILTSDNSKEAYDIILKQGIDALILDLSVEKDAISFIKEIHSNRKILPFPILVISVKAAKNKGELKANTFTIIDWLTKPIDNEHLLNAIKAIKKQIRTNIPSILHIEDDNDLLRIVAVLLEQEANITGVTNLKEAEKLLKKHNYDLVILDLLLPDGYGFELIPKLSEKHIPIIVYSAYDLPKEYTKYVIKTLVKSKISPYEFFQTIKSSLVGKILEKGE